MIIDAGHGEGFCMGNIMKYAKRYGRKDGRNRADLMKILHYGIIMLYPQSFDEVTRTKTVRFRYGKTSFIYFGWMDGVIEGGLGRIAEAMR